MHFRHRFFYCCFSILSALLARGADTETLWAAARTDDASRVRELVIAGASVDARDANGRTALMHAAGTNSFGALRELLFLAADPTLAAPDGRAALAFVDPDKDDARACQLVLRAYVFMRANGRPPAYRPAHPHLVLVYEETVNYLHPLIKERYYVNSAEVNGRPGVDDDGNGFVDDVYGWNLTSNRSHAISQLQFDIYLRGRETLARLAKAYNQRKAGEISEAQLNAAMAGHDNPLAEIFTAGAGTSNKDFFEKARRLAHGTHVAGIIVEHSRNTALLHTLSYGHFGSSVSLTQPAFSKQITNLRDYLTESRRAILTEGLATGRRFSDYVRQTGAGVVNMSVGKELENIKASVERMAMAYVAKSGGEIANRAQLLEALGDFPFEFHLADAVEFLVPMMENPDVLFVVAASNESSNNDYNYENPAYLSRLLPNVITVAAVDRDEEEADFTNFGRRSVDLGAPGVNILSTVIPEASLVFSGTSMATPAVAGASAYVRYGRPDIPAWELKKLIQYTAKPAGSLAKRTITGGVLNEKRLFDLAGTAPDRAEAFAYAAHSAAVADSERMPGHAADADWLSKTAIQMDPRSAEAWRIRAACLDIRGRTAEAVEPIERAAQLGPDAWDVWRSRGIIFAGLKNQREALASYQRAVAAAERSGAVSAAGRANLHASCAQYQLALGNRSAARTEAQAARQLNADVKLTAAVAELLQ